MLLRNISCLYHTAKAELARRTAEITGLRMELFTLSKEGGAQQQQQHLRGRPGQEHPRLPGTRWPRDGPPPAPHALEGGGGRQGEGAGWREAPREARAGPAVGAKRGRADGGEPEADGPASTRQRVEQQGRPLERGGSGGLGNVAREACRGGAAAAAGIVARRNDGAVDGAQRGSQGQQQSQSQDRLERRQQAEPLGMRRPGGTAEQLPAASQGQAADGRGRGRDGSGVGDREERGRQNARHEQSVSGGCSGVRVRSGADGVGSREGRGEGSSQRDGSAERRGARSGGGADRDRACGRERERERHQGREREQERSGWGREKDRERDVRSKGDETRERERERDYGERKEGGSERGGARDWPGREERGSGRDGGLDGNKENSGQWREGERRRGEERARS